MLWGTVSLGAQGVDVGRAERKLGSGVFTGCRLATEGTLCGGGGVIWGHLIKSVQQELHFQPLAVSGF